MWHIPQKRNNRKMMINNILPSIFQTPNDSRKIHQSFPQAETVNQTALCSPGPLWLQQRITTRRLRR
jgi:hypothetical protein